MYLQYSEMAILKILILIITWTIAVTNEEKPLCSDIPDDPMGLILVAGYEGEEHRVQTSDGYVLTLHRLLPSARRRLAEARPRHLPVFLQHGLWSSSYSWLLAGPGKALPFILSEEGYDVWMGNSRGNYISREHVFLSTNSSKFWDFSFHEMGFYDLPAVIDYILNDTGKEKLHYVGHSMGTTMFFVMASLRPDVAAKVNNMVALAPIATVRPIQNLLRVATLLQKSVIKENTQFGILSRNGISTKTILHFMQLYLTGNFSMYDYGTTINMQKYNTPVAPSYKISHISIPVLLCYGTEDPFSTSEDVETLQHSLGTVEDLWQFPLNHLEFVEGTRRKSMLFYNIVYYLKRRTILEG